MTMSPLAPTQPSRPPAAPEARGDQHSSGSDAFKELLSISKPGAPRGDAEPVHAANKNPDSQKEGEQEVTEERRSDGKTAKDRDTGMQIFVLPERVGKPAEEPAKAGGKARQESDADTDSGGKKPDMAQDGAAVALPACAAEPAQRNARTGKENTANSKDEDMLRQRGAAAEAPGIRDGVAASQAIANIRDGVHPRRAGDGDALHVASGDDGDGSALAAARNSEATDKRIARTRAETGGAGDKAKDAQLQLNADPKVGNGGRSSGPARVSAMNIDRPDRKEAQGEQRTVDHNAAKPHATDKPASSQAAQTDPSATARPAAGSSVANSIVDAVKANANWSTYLKAPTAKFHESSSTQGQVLQAIKVQLHPAELGMLTLHLRAAGNRITVDIKAQEHAAHKLVADGLDSVAKSFQTLGYQVDHVNLTSSGDRSSTLGQWTGDGRERGGADGRRQDGGHASQTARDDRDPSRGAREQRSHDRDRGGRTLYI